MPEKPEVFVYQVYEGYYPEGGAADIYAYGLNAFDVIEEALRDIFERVVNPVEQYYTRFCNFHQVVSLKEVTQVDFHPNFEEKSKKFRLKIDSYTSSNSEVAFAEKLALNLVEDYNFEELGYTAEITIGEHNEL